MEPESQVTQSELLQIWFIVIWEWALEVIQVTHQEHGEATETGEEETSELWVDRSSGPGTGAYLNLKRL